MHDDPAACERTAIAHQRLIWEWRNRAEAAEDMLARVSQERDEQQERADRAEAALRGAEETAADRVQTALHWRERAEAAEATIERMKRTNRMVNSGARDARERAERAEAELDRYRSAVYTGSLLGLGEEAAIAARTIAETLEPEVDRYRAAWQSARRRAEAYGDGILRLVDERDQYEAGMREQGARAERAEVALASVRRYAELMTDSVLVAVRGYGVDLLGLAAAPKPDICDLPHRTLAEEEACDRAAGIEPEETPR